MRSRTIVAAAGLLVAAALTATALAACSPPRPAAVRTAGTSAPVQLAVLGDSLAFGTGAGDTSGGFAFRIYRAIDAQHPGSEITNMAIGGSTAADVLRLQARRLREARFDLVLLCVGGNDVVRNVPTRTFRARYARLVATIRRDAPQAGLVIIGVPDVSISPLFADRANAVESLAHADDEAAREIAATAGARYVDLFALTRRMHDAAGFLSLDRFHPSDSGHAAIAAEAMPAVTAALRTGRSALARRATGGAEPLNFEEQSTISIP